MNVFIFFLALITNTGELQIATKVVDACPDKETFVAQMEELKSTGKIKEWDANCVAVPTAPGQSI
jgi:hypothetical protein